MSIMSIMQSRFGVIMAVAACFSLSLSFPEMAQAVTCGAGSDNGAGRCLLFLTSGAGENIQTWSVPTDWNPTNNEVFCIGAGGDGANSGGTGNSRPGAGGGGGAFASSTNFSLTPGGSATYSVGAHATTTAGNIANETFFDGTASSTATLSCAFGRKGTNATTGGAGGQASQSRGTTKNAGGNGGGATQSANRGGGGGGGSGGPKGAGKNGGAGGTASIGAGGGGGGSNGGTSTAGSQPSAISAGGAGGAGTGGSGGGSGATSGASAVAGSSGGGGGGGMASTTARLVGALGGLDTTFDATHGAGGGGGGAAGTTTSGNVATGGAGATYGGGGGGAGGSTASSLGGSGGQGIIGILYTPAVAPTVTTSAASSITKTTATANGDITVTGGQNSTVRGFAWGTNSSLAGGDTATTTESGDFGVASFTTALSSLTCNTTYYTRAYATNYVGSGYGSIQSFTTSACAPTVTTQAASSITNTTATYNGTITVTGGANSTVRGFAWGTNSSLAGGDTATTTESGSFGTGAFTYAASGLTCGTTYYTRAYATNTGGDGLGSIQSFATVCSATVSTDAPSGLTDIDVTYNATISATGGGAATTCGFAYGTDRTMVNDTSTTTDSTCPGGTGSFTKALSGLTTYARYYVRAYATNAGGTAYGSIYSYEQAADAPVGARIFRLGTYLLLGGVLLFN